MTRLAVAAAATELRHASRGRDRRARRSESPYAPPPRNAQNTTEIRSNPNWSSSFPAIDVESTPAIPASRTIAITGSVAPAASSESSRIAVKTAPGLCTTASARSHHRAGARQSGRRRCSRPERTLRFVPRTALIIAVPEAEPLVHAWRMRHDNAAKGVPAHITLLVPFVPPHEIDESLLIGASRALRLGACVPFSLPRVARFPDLAWLAPEPDEPFRRLTELIVGSYPAYLPYEGIHEEVVPHLTVAKADAALQDEIETSLTPHLPIEAEAREVTLLVEDDAENWRPHSHFVLHG